MVDESPGFVWIFMQAGARFPGGAFTSRKSAEAWISTHKLTGVLTAYPVDTGAFDWAVAQGFFTPSNPNHRSSSFVGGFTSARMEHAHFEDGQLVSSERRDEKSSH